MPLVLKHHHSIILILAISVYYAGEFQKEFFVMPL